MALKRYIVKTARDRIAPAAALTYSMSDPDSIRLMESGGMLGNHFSSSSIHGYRSDEGTTMRSGHSLQ